MDLLITDKSSIFTDFLHCNKPIIFIKNNRINETDADNIFMSQLPGVETELHSVGAAVERVLTKDEFVQIRAELKSKAFDTSAADACKEINSYFAELVPTLVA